MAEGCSKRAAEEVSQNNRYYCNPMAANWKDTCKPLKIDICTKAGLPTPNSRLIEALQGIAKHMSTAPVARDIIEIFERHGQWRDAEAKRLVSSDTTMSVAEKESIIQRTAYRPGEEMVQYW